MKLAACVLAFLGGSLLAACPQPPLPPVPPGPGPTTDAAPPIQDRFTGHRYDCHGQDLNQRASAMGRAAACLSGPAPAQCLLGLPYDDRTVACAARDAGAQANHAATAGGTAEDKAVADAARTWITAEQLGFW